MSTHEHDEIADYHVIGNGTYSNLRVAEVIAEDEIVAITPVAMPKSMLVGVNLIFVLFGLGFYLLIHYLAPDQRLFAAAASAGIVCLICGLFTAFTVYSVRRESRLGPWLIYEKETRCVILPREKMHFSFEEVIHFQLITSKYLNFQVHGAVSELNLITGVGGERKRWVLLRDNATSKPLKDIVEPLIDFTDLPVMRYRKRRGKPIEIQDMRTADLGRDLYLY